MYIPFEQLPDTARLWVYGAPRPFRVQELDIIDATAPQFMEGWATHGTPLQASYQVLMDQFLILAVDEGVQQASGCSIDSSMGYVRDLEQRLGVSLTDRSQIYFLVNDQVEAYPLSQIKQLAGQGTLTPQTTLINTLVANKKELNEQWLLAAGESWLKRHFKKATV